MAVGRPISLTPNIATKTVSSTATADQTSFTVTGGYRINELGVYRNGVRLVQGKDFTANDGSTVTLLSGATVDDAIDFVIFDSFNIADAINSVGNQTIDGELTVSKIIGDGSELTGIGTADINTNNIQVSGISTFGSGASTFSGEVTAAGGVDVTGGVKSAGIVSFTNTTASTSTTTGALIVSGGVGIAGSLHVGENVSVGGTLTYEDVTNIDSVGIVTAQTGVRVTAGCLVVTAGVSTIGADLSIADKIVHTGDTNTAIRFSAADTIRAETGGTARLEIDSTGRVSINEVGTYNDADEYLLVKNTGDACNLSIVGGTSHHSSINMGDTDDFNIQKIKSDHTNNSLQFFTNNAEKVRIDSSGNVGINTTNPNHELTVFGDEVNFRLTHSGSTNKYNALYTNVNGTGVEFNSYQDGTGTKRPFSFKQYDVERLGIDASGRVGINTDSFNDAREALRVQAPAGQTDTFVTIKAASDTGYSALFFGDTDFNEGRIQYQHNGDYLQFYTDDSERARITKTGAISLNNGELVERCYIQSSPAWSSNGAVDLDNGVVQYNTSNYGSGGAGSLYFTSSVGINTQMANGDIMSLTMMTNVNSTAGYINNIFIDGQAVTETWVGGSAPTAGGGSGVDIYTFNIIKTASATYTVIANQVKTSA